MSARPRTRVRPETLSRSPVGAHEKAIPVAGLCHKCAAQAAWAYQSGAGGWGAIHPPCAECVGIVEMFAYPTTNPLWRSVIRKRREYGCRARARA